MNMIKVALAGAATLGLVLASTANAAPTRSGSALPLNTTVKKLKLTRTVAPSSREAKAVEGADVGLGLLAGAAAGFALYEATKGGDDSPAG